jgi:hypothetical protein
MDKSDSQADELKVGFNIGKHDSALVGNRQGLENLRDAITEAIETGKSDRVSGDVLGVDCVSDEEMDELYSGGSWISRAFAATLAMAVLAIFVIGLVEVVSNILNKCC